MDAEHFDVIVVGAGLSGVGAGYYLQTDCPNKRYAILEARADMGGTWDLFRYPGIRSDSDMFTLGYSFRPWREAKAIADGPAILRYIKETAAEFGIDRHIRFQHRVVHADFASAEGRWHLTAERGPGKERTYFTCDFLYLCSGYYDYAEGHNPTFPGSESFQGQIVHPQHWPTNLHYAGKRIVVIGSGATAVTLVPELAKQASHVTMLQRSPTYIVSLPAKDPVANALRWLLPEKLAYSLCRWKNVLYSMFFYSVARKTPGVMKWLIRKGNQRELGPAYEARHFTPPYNPWDQRLCLVPDADLFLAIKGGKVTMVTDQIDRFTEDGILLKSGAKLPADLVVTATGLKLKLLGGMTVAVDGQAIQPADRKVYKGMMISDLPNFAFAIGYTNASWTLKVDLTSKYLCRLLNYMDQRGYQQCWPEVKGDVGEEPLLDFTSGYVQRALDQLPKQGSKAPWKLYQNYIRDVLTLRYGSVTDSMRFVPGRPRSAAPASSREPAHAHAS